MAQIIEPQQLDAGNLRMSAIGVSVTTSPLSADGSSISAIQADATKLRTSSFQTDAGLLRMSAIGVSITQTADASTFTKAATVSGGLAYGLYTSATDTLTDSQVGVFGMDANRNQKVREQYAPGFEDNTNGVAKVEERFSYNNLITSSPTTIKSGAGFIHKIIFNQPFPNILKVYDNTTAATTLIGTLSGGLAISALGNWQPNVSFATGLTISATSGTPDLTIAYR